MCLIICLETVQGKFLRSYYRPNDSWFVTVNALAARNISTSNSVLIDVRLWVAVQKKCLLSRFNSMRTIARLPNKMITPNEHAVGFFGLPN